MLKKTSKLVQLHQRRQTNDRCIQNMPECMLVKLLSIFAFDEASTNQGLQSTTHPARDSDGASSQGLSPDLELCYKTITPASLVAHTMWVALRARQLDELHVNVKSIWRFLRSFYSFWCIMSRSWIIASWQWGGLVSNHHEQHITLF